MDKPKKLILDGVSYLTILDYQQKYKVEHLGNLGFNLRVPLNSKEAMYKRVKSGCYYIEDAAHEPRMAYYKCEQ